jgi:DNA-binding beta-propeller fold protein YncE
MKKILVLASVVTLATLGGCGGGAGSGSPDAPIGDVKVANITTGSTFSFDIGAVVGTKYYVTDRNNKSVDVIDIATMKLTQIIPTGANAFAGCSPTANCVGANNGKSGPDGLNAITGTNFIYVGDVNSVKVIDRTTNTVVKTITVGNTGFRADEGCYDADDHLFMISSPDADQPFATFINTDTQTVVAQVNWVDTNGQPAGGNEACAYDHGTHSFLVNNDNTVANPHGELEMIPASSITSLAAGSTVNVFSLAGVKRFPLGNCDPTGLDLGPGTDAIVECRQGDAKQPLTTLIVNRTTGAILATINAGGGDQVWYDARTNKYYVAASRWHTSGVNDLGGGCSATNPCDPKLFIIDAGSRQLVRSIPTGNNAHSVAVDRVTGQVFLPYSSATAPSGCPQCAQNSFVDGGVSIFQPGA